MNEPAFPVTPSDGLKYDEQHKTIFPHRGMTLRDYFAAKAMQGMVSTNDTGGITGALEFTGLVSKSAYCIADAMLKTREVG